MSINSFSDEDREILKGIIGTGDDQADEGEDKDDEPAATPAATAEVTPVVEEKDEAKPTADAAAPEKKGDPHKAALRASRRGEERANARAERLQRELDELKAAQPKQQPTDDDITDDELETLQTDFPLVAKAVRVVKASKSQQPAAKAEALPADPSFTPRAFAPETQELIDGNDDALAWQNDPDQSRFDLFDAMAGTLLKHPVWKTKPANELIDEAVRRVNAELQDDPPPPKPPKQRKDPDAELKNAAPRGPRSISDVPGASGATDDSAARSARFNRMSDEDILQELALGG